MLWYKSWLETRWRFLIGAAILLCSAVAMVAMYPRFVALLPLVPGVDTSTDLGRLIRDNAELARTYRGYIWSQWFRQSLPQVWTLFAALLGAGGLLSETSRGGALFTLSMPVSRARLIGTRTAAGLIELFALTVLPALALPLVSPAVGETYRMTDAMVHAVCLFVGGAAFFSLAVLLSTLFADVWRPLLIALGVAGALGVNERAFRAFAPYGLVGLMSGESYFRSGQLPWAGLAISAAASAALLASAVVSIQQHDF